MDEILKTLGWILLFGSLTLILLGEIVWATQIIMKSMADVDYEMVRMPIIILLTRSMQGITESEMKDLGQKLAEIESTEELSNQDRAYALGFLALNLAGDDFFKEVFNLNERQKYLIAPDTITDTNNKANHYS